LISTTWQDRDIKTYGGNFFNWSLDKIRSELDGFRPRRSPKTGH
jgi:hypothetical protein